MVARVAVQLLARSDRRAGCVTRGRVGSRRSAPTWRGCMPPAWLPALSPAGLGESGGMLVTAGQLRASRAVVLAPSALGQLARCVGPSPRVVGGGPWSVLEKTQPATAEDASGESCL